MPQNLAGVQAFNRPVKPVALGFTALMAITLSYNLFDQGVLGSLWLGNVVAALSGAAAAALTVGWWTTNQHMAEWGLLATAATEMLRGVFVLLVFGPTLSAVWGSLCFAIIAGGSYLLEAWDDPNHQRRH